MTPRPLAEASDEFARGVREGRVDALLESHTQHLTAINGSIERCAVANEKLTLEVRSLGLAIRSLEEQRRSEAAELDGEGRARAWRFTRHERLAALSVSLVLVVLNTLGLVATLR